MDRLAIYAWMLVGVQIMNRFAQIHHRIAEQWNIHGDSWKSKRNLRKHSIACFQYVKECHRVLEMFLGSEHSDVLCIVPMVSTF